MERKTLMLIIIAWISFILIMACVFESCTTVKPVKRLPPFARNAMIASIQQPPKPIIHDSIKTFKYAPNNN